MKIAFIFSSLWVFCGLVSGAAAAPAQQSSSAPAVQPSTAAGQKNEKKEPEPPEIEALQIAFATSISSMNPVAPSTSFDDSSRVYFWNRLRVVHPPTKINHVWYYNDKKVDEFQIDAKYHRLRLWTHKKVVPGMWRVDITDEAGNLIMMGTFLVHKADPARAAAPKERKNEPKRAPSHDFDQ